MTQIRFKECWDKELYLSDRSFNNGDFDYWFVVRIYETKDTGLDFPEKYFMYICVVAPSLLTKEQKKHAYEGINKKPETEYPELLSEYGYHACLFDTKGNNHKKLLKQAREECIKMKLLFGFYMDRPQNMLGATGWDFIRGDIVPERVLKK